MDWWLGCWSHESRVVSLIPTSDRSELPGRHFQSDTKAAFTLTILPDARTVRERYAPGCPCTHCVHCVGFVRYTQTASGGVLCGRERYASGWRCSVNAQVDASGTAATPVCACLQTDLFLSTPLICNAANRARRNHDTVG